MRRCLFLALVLTAAVLAACGDDSSAPPMISVVAHDIPYPTEKNLRIGYTIATWEYEKEGLELQRIIAFDNDTKIQLMLIDKKDLPEIYKEPLAPNPFFVLDRLTCYYLSIQLPIPLGQAAPKTISHRFIFKDAGNATEVAIDGARFSPRIRETPVVIASPVKGKNLAFICQSTMGYHFYVSVFMRGDIYNPERYAVDSVQFDDAVRTMFDGDPKVNESYFNYGSTLYAVADGVVVQMRDGLPDNSGNQKTVTFNSAMDLAGNYLVIDIGGGRYAYYCHCIPNSFLVRVGDRVREGDPIARLGNSGDSDLPHLHFQVSDSPDFWFSKGIPFVLKEYTLIANETGFVPRTRLTNAMMEQTSVFSVP